jgi:hypothetical protein
MSLASDLSPVIAEAGSALKRKDPVAYWQAVDKAVFLSGFKDEEEANTLTDKFDAAFRRKFGEV